MERLTRLMNRFGVAIVTMFAVAAVVYAEGIFVAPTQAPPGGNTDAPLNVGASNQIKNGALGVNSLAVFNNAVVNGNLDAKGGYSANGVPGITRTCINGNVLIDPIVAGGILTGGNCGAGGGVGGSIPSGMIAMFDAACPGGWTRFAALDGRFPLGSASYGLQGGSLTSGGPSYSTDLGAQNKSGTNVGPHTHSIDYPPYIGVVWCKKI